MTKLKNTKSGFNNVQAASKTLEVNSLCKRYDKKSVYAVENISFSCARGEIVGLVGANGAGKSTTLKCITGMLNATSGFVRICGFDIEKQPIEAKRGFSFVSDNHAVFEKLTGMKYLAFMADVYGVESSLRRERIEMLRNVFNFGDEINSLIAFYSHGMKQKICMMGSLIGLPPLWILDEPMLGLDPTAQASVLSFMQRYAKEGKTVLFSTHNMDVVEKLCHRKIVIDKGRIVCDKAIMRDADFDFRAADFEGAGCSEDCADSASQSGE